MVLSDPLRVWKQQANLMEGDMRSAKSVGRTVGVLLLVHFFTGLMLPFILVNPVIASPGYLENAAANPGLVRASMFLSFVSGLVTVGIAITAFPIFRRYSERLALWFVALSVVSFSLQAVENGTLLSTLSLSQEYAKRGAANGELFRVLSVVVGSARKWAHYLQLLVVVSWMFLLYGVLYRFRLVPRVLCALGLVGTLLQICSVTLRGLLGYPPAFVFAMPLAPIHFALTVWLMAKGFDDRNRPVQAQPHSVEVAAV